MQISITHFDYSLHLPGKAMRHSLDNQDRNESFPGAGWQIYNGIGL